MNFFPTAHAEESLNVQQTADQGNYTMLIIMAVAFVLFYVFVLRPQNKKRKEAQNALSKITVGDEVVTNGGIIGRIVKESEDKSTLSVQINENNIIMIKRAYVVSALPKGTLEQYQVSPKK
jgi:preprotein translocase subunit YajC